ncbi:hypothetical protein OXX79_013862, partial [Metschnikowia pulcherrima]
SVAAIVERLDDEFAKCLQFTDPHSTEYIERLRDESSLYTLIVRAQIYVQSTAGHAEHLAHQLILVNEKAAWANTWDGIGLDASPLLTQGKSAEETVRALTGFLAAQQAQLYKRSALLASTYYLAVNNRYAEAREQFLQ